MGGDFKNEKKYVLGFFLIGVLLTIFSMTSFADESSYCNGSDLFVNDNGEFFSNIDDEDKLYCKKTPQITEIKVLDKHIMSMVSDQNKNLYLLVYEGANTDLISFNTKTYEYNKLWSFNSVVTNIAMREDKVYMKTNIGIQYYDIKTNTVGNLIENTNIDFIYFSDFNTLSYYSTNDNDEYDIHTYSFSNVKKTAINNSISLMSASSYSPRLSEPATNNAYYTSWNVFHTSGYGMVDGNGNKRGNCTCYAYGRSYENLGYKPSLCTGNAGTWYSYNSNNGFYLYGKTPYLGAVAVWSKSGAAGHVAVVEVIDGDTVITSESGWNSFYFKTVTRSASNYNFSASSSYNFLGFIYVCGTNSNSNPLTAQLSIEREYLNPGDSVAFHFSGQNTTGVYTLGIYKGADRIDTITVYGDTYYYKCTDIAMYSAYMTSYNSGGGYADSNWVGWQVNELTATISVNKTKFDVAETAVLTLGGNNNKKYDNGCCTLGVWRNGSRIVSENVYSDQYNVYCSEPGTYSAYMTAYGGGNFKDSNWVYWTVGEFSQTIQNGRYSILTSINSNYALNVQGRYTANEVPLLLWTDPSQYFDITYLGDGYYSIISAITGKSINVKNGGIDSGTDLVQYDWNNSPNQRWKIIDSGNNTYYIQNQNGLYVNVTDGNASNGTLVQLYEGNSSSAQKWIFQPLTYPIYYNGNGVSDAPFTQYKHYNIDLILQKTILTRPGYIFWGWADNNPNADNATYPAG